jgi:hypothetical protein
MDQRRRAGSLPTRISKLTSPGPGRLATAAPTGGRHRKAGGSFGPVSDTPQRKAACTVRRLPCRQSLRLSDNKRHSHPVDAHRHGLHYSRRPRRVGHDHALASSTGTLPRRLCVSTPNACPRRDRLLWSTRPTPTGENGSLGGLAMHLSERSASAILADPTKSTGLMMTR